MYDEIYCHTMDENAAKRKKKWSHLGDEIEIVFKRKDFEIGAVFHVESLVFIADTVYNELYN